jgi:hypothetical protein
MTGEERSLFDRAPGAILSGLPPEEIARRLSVYARRVSDREQNRLLACLRGTRAPIRLSNAPWTG